MSIPTAIPPPPRSTSQQQPGNFGKGCTWGGGEEDKEG